MRDSGDVGVLCTFGDIRVPAAAAAGIARSSQLSSALPGRWYDIAGGTARPSTVQISSLHPSPPGGAERRFGSALYSLRPLSAQLTLQNKGEGGGVAAHTSHKHIFASKSFSRELFKTLEFLDFLL